MIGPRDEHSDTRLGSDRVFWYKDIESFRVFLHFGLDSGILCPDSVIFDRVSDIWIFKKKKLKLHCLSSLYLKYTFNIISFLIFNRLNY